MAAMTLSPICKGPQRTVSLRAFRIPREDGSMCTYPQLGHYAARRLRTSTSNV